MSTSHTHTIFAENFFRSNAELFVPFLAEVGLDERILHSPEAEIPLARYVELWEILGRKVEPSIGLRIGMQTGSSALGAYGHAVRSAPTMELVLRCLSHFIVVFSQATRVDMAEDAQRVSLSYQITDPAIVQRRQDAEFSLGIALSLLREVTQNAELKPQRVDFEHPAPTDLTAYRELFQCPVHFNQRDNRLYFPRELMDMPVRTADPRLFQALEPFLEQQRQSRAAATDLLSRLGHHIASTLSSGGASLELVAKSMGMGPRTLQRRLADHQVEFSQLVEEVRRSLAQAYVTQPEYSLTDIALLLGYAEASSFSRAFRRWTQLTPQQYRKQSRSSVD
ncbi:MULTISPECIES: AraC family transcriptional regulator [Pseudomonas]|uniref:AraC family transcriptional regulator n=1 Tax=Pseudomonas fluorescens LMG 5329 TaxID=1324332 RepID=A0A0A1Z000_PSEFL|nr:MULTISPECIES: AraC family transcriptional regulator [Pseudomonas]KGE67615.1 AraC family transcriptional regulator [Pseudomonas fluorescens LMG 5329]NWE04802.1 AraC family transcriptional regulator [Pseudomonas sp. IPO3749]NWF24563.1 AraC family transcriptional regulator [Pseudomonas sp. IPO3749]